MRAFATQLRTELTLSTRQGEQLLVSIGIPLLILVFFSTVDVLPTGTSEPIEFLAPSVLALAVMSTAMVSLGIGTGFERMYGVLKRLGGSPLGRGRWVSAKIATVLVTEVVQWTVLITVSLLLGWSPPGAGWAAAVAGRPARHRGLRRTGPADGGHAAGSRHAGRCQPGLYSCSC